MIALPGKQEDVAYTTKTPDYNPATCYDVANGNILTYVIYMDIFDIQMSSASSSFLAKISGIVKLKS